MAAFDDYYYWNGPVNTYRYVLKVDGRLYYGVPFATDVTDPRTLVSNATYWHDTGEHLHAVERQQVNHRGELEWMAL